MFPNSLISSHLIIRVTALKITNIMTPKGKKSSIYKRWPGIIAAAQLMDKSFSPWLSHSAVPHRNVQYILNEKT
jgi:hypothetical protein